MPKASRSGKARMPIIAITIGNSTKVKARFPFFFISQRTAETRLTTKTKKQKNNVDKYFEMSEAAAKSSPNSWNRNQSE